MTLNSHHIHRVADNLNQVVGICYNAGYIYWTDISKQVESVMRSRILGRPEVLSYLIFPNRNDILIFCVLYMYIIRRLFSPPVLVSLKILQSIM